jgi:hypothetical protein
MKTYQTTTHPDYTITVDRLRWLSYEWRVYSADSGRLFPPWWLAAGRARTEKAALSEGDRAVADLVSR